MWVCFQEAVFVWPCQHEGQAHSWWLSRNCCCLLCTNFCFPFLIFNIITPIKIFIARTDLTDNGTNLKPENNTEPMLAKCQEKIRRIMSSYTNFFQSHHISTHRSLQHADELRYWYCQRRARFWVLREPFGTPVHSSDERVRSRQRWPGAACQSLVWPRCRVPHLLYPLEPLSCCVSICLTIFTC